MNLAQAMEKKAGKASAFLSGLANEHRLLVLCHLLEGEQNVTSLIEATNIPQTSMSQHLAKLKKRGARGFSARSPRALLFHQGSGRRRDHEGALRTVLSVDFR